MKPFKLSDIIHIKSRFGRSVNLERDFYNHVLMDGYVLTTTARQSLKRLVEAFSDDFATRAWTLTGPYGSGKSTFALFVAKIFGNNPSEESDFSRILLKETDFDFWKALFADGNTLFDDSKSAPKFFSILVSGSRESLAKAIIRGIITALVNSGDENLLNLVIKAEALQKEEQILGRHIVNLLSDIYVEINTGETKVGVLLVVDELGKLLEYAAIHPTESDIFLLQEIAEATKSKETPLFLLTILHQSFERYAEKLGRREREEWMKVQGRFEDLPFQEPNEQVLQVLKDAFSKTGTSAQLSVISEYGEELALNAYDLGICGNLKQEVAVDLLKGCLPLHPTVALTLGPTFRRFGQNERSLFAFLTSNETYFGLSGFLETTEWTKQNRETVQLDRLYDYLISAMGSALYAGTEGRKWAEVDAAINRLTDASELEFRIVKTIGLLKLLGDVGRLKSSREVLHFALVSDKVSEKEIDEALEQLERKSIITKRNYNNTFTIWEGSDIDLEERFRQAQRQVDLSVPLTERLSKNFRPQPIVAKRHSYQKGTLRFFELLYTDINNLNEVCNRELSESDGQIIYLLTNNQEEFTNAVSQIRNKELKVNKQTIIAIPKDLANLKEAAYAVDCWQWVRQNTPELQNDRAARNELLARLSYFEQSVQRWIAELQNGKTSQKCVWFWKNEEVQLQSTRGLQEFLSTVCDDVYSKTPVLKNELINRRKPSGAANSARKSLFEAMLTNGDKEQLGIVGFPPQLSIYFSLLQETTIHREENGKLGFFPPNRSADKGIQAVWKEIEAFLQKTETTRLTVAKLFESLQKPPYGLKQGILPILFTVVLLYHDAELALYEQGSFVPRLTKPVLEKISVSPENFTLQLCRIEGVRSHVIEKLATRLLPAEFNAKEKQLDVLSIIRPLARFAKEMDEFTRNTSRISPESQKVRRALFSAREPDTLLFKQLPEAFGLPEFKEEVAYSEEQINEFCQKLQSSLSEIKRIYDDLLHDLEQMLRGSFNLKQSGEEARIELKNRVESVVDYASSPKLKSFIIRAGDTETDFRSWLESLGALIVSKPVAMWHDEDVSRFEVNLAEIVRSYTSLESLAFELKQKAASGDLENEGVIRLSLTKFGQEEKERVLTVDSGNKDLIEKLESSLEDSLEKEFEKFGLNGNSEMRLTVLANLSWKILQKAEKD